MVDMTTSQIDPARDTAGRFATQTHTAPEVGLDADNLTTEDLTQNVDGHYGWEEPLIPAEELAEDGSARDIDAEMDDYFSGPEPVHTGGDIELFDRSTWVDTPF